MVVMLGVSEGNKHRAERCVPTLRSSAGSRCSLGPGRVGGGTERGQQRVKATGRVPMLKASGVLRGGSC